MVFVFADFGSGRGGIKTEKCTERFARVAQYTIATNSAAGRAAGRQATAHIAAGGAAGQTGRVRRREKRK